MNILVYNIASVASVVGAVVVMLEGKDGWGWLLLVAVALHTTPKVVTK